MSYCDSSSILPPTNSCLTTQQSSQMCVCSFAPSLFRLFPPPPSSNGSPSLLFHDNKTFALLLKIGEICVFVTCVSFFRPVLSFPLSIAQIVNMKIFSVFTENHLQPLCNMILEEKGVQALRGTLETSPVFSVKRYVTGTFSIVFISHQLISGVP